MISRLFLSLSPRCTQTPELWYIRERRGLEMDWRRHEEPRPTDAFCATHVGFGMPPLKARVEPPLRCARLRGHTSQTPPKAPSTGPRPTRFGRDSEPGRRAQPGAPRRASTCCALRCATPGEARAVPRRACGRRTSPGPPAEAGGRRKMSNAMSREDPTTARPPRRDDRSRWRALKTKSPPASSLWPSPPSPSAAGVSSASGRQV